MKNVTMDEAKHDYCLQCKHYKAEEVERCGWAVLWDYKCDIYLEPEWNKGEQGFDCEWLENG